MMKIELLNHWGSDLDVVNNARVSFDKTSDWVFLCPDCGAPPGSTCGRAGPSCLHTYRKALSNEDKRLVGYLARGCTQGDWDEMVQEAFYASEMDTILEILGHVKRMPEHWAPFANGIGMKYRITAPISIMRQVFKHKVGTVESEVSRRYVDELPDIYYPTFRERADNVKQGSGGPLIGPRAGDAQEAYEFAVKTALDAYEELLDLGVAPEQARFVLPQGTMTTAIVSNSLYGWARFFNQRSDRSHAQSEIADLADIIAEDGKQLFPVSWKALTQ